ncbi:hypothetical protein B0I35DRAFT_473632 [Stachybotrys elegans]|uniref:SUZ domain-containing protein n=1 Tax=Stachybotrys elegans TaxID=80388 RepID=A0A8K0T6G9_9HYPO|nr:hypothetical protein B0I35DRAFT_473632 [Stachybotrys elegans]
MGKKTQVPDAWEDDDWETQADKAAAVERLQPPQPAPALSKAERLAQHAESNRKLWQSADTPETFHFLEASSSVPQATTNFKPQVKVLSRKPVIAKNPAAGMAQLSLEDDGDGDEGKRVQLSPEELRAKQKRDRDEKQRRYEEARAKIFGESAPSSGASSPGTTTPPRSEGRPSQGRGRGRGGSYRNSMNNNNSSNNNNSNNENRQFDSRRNLSSTGGRELYDPNFSPKPDSLSAQRRAGGGDDFQGRGSFQRDAQQQAAIRAPRGPDGSGRGGFGFARGRGKES